VAGWGNTIRILLHGIIRDHPKDIGSVEEEVQSEVAAHEYPKYYMRVLATQGGTLKVCHGTPRRAGWIIWSQLGLRSA
jgi:hypothetical protein